MCGTESSLRVDIGIQGGNPPDVNYPQTYLKNPPILLTVSLLTLLLFVIHAKMRDAAKSVKKSHVMPLYNAQLNPVRNGFTTNVVILLNRNQSL